MTIRILLCLTGLLSLGALASCKAAAKSAARAAIPSTSSKFVSISSIKPRPKVPVVRSPKSLDGRLFQDISHNTKQIQTLYLDISPNTLDPSLIGTENPHREELGAFAEDFYGDVPEKARWPARWFIHHTSLPWIKSYGRLPTTLDQKLNPEDQFLRDLGILEYYENLVRDYTNFGVILQNKDKKFLGVLETLYQKYGLEPGVQAMALLRPFVDTHQFPYTQEVSALGTLSHQADDRLLGGAQEMEKIRLKKIQEFFGSRIKSAQTSKPR